MRLIGLYLFGCAVVALGFALSTVAVSIMGGWLAGFAVGVLLTSYVVRSKAYGNKDIKSLIREL